MAIPATWPYRLYSRPHQNPGLSCLTETQPPPPPHQPNMVKRKSIKTQELDLRLSEAVLGVKTRKYKSANAAAIALGLRPDTVRKRISGIHHTHAEGHLLQQLLSKNQEQTLLKWIKGLTASGYAPSHRILREVAEEVRSNKCRVFQVS